MSSDKRYANRQSVNSIDASLNEEQQHVADSYYYGLVETRKLYGAYYRVGDPLRDAALAKLASMDPDDPDVQLRLAYALEQQGTPESYKQAMDLYRTVRDHRERDIRLVLVKDYELGRSGLAIDPRMAKYWRTYVEKGYEAARPILRPNE